MRVKDEKQPPPLPPPAADHRGSGEEVRVEDRVPVSGWPRQRTRRPHPGDQLQEQSSLGMLQNVYARELFNRPGAPAQDPPTQRGRHIGATVRLRGVIHRDARSIPVAARDTRSTTHGSYRIPAHAGNISAAVLRTGAETSRLREL